MYNHETKQRFIRSYTTSMSTARYAEYSFDSIQKYEEELGRDIFLMSERELQYVLDKVFSLRKDSQWMITSIIREYIRWCRSEGFDDVSDAIFHIKPLGIEKLRTQMVANPHMLQMFLDTLYEPEKEETVNNIYRCYLWMAFFGIEEEDAIEMTTEQVDFRSMTIHVRDNEYAMYQESLMAFRLAATLSDFRILKSNSKPGSNFRQERQPGNKLLRSMKSTEILAKHLRSEISHRNAALIRAGKMTQSLSYKRIRLSGEFYRLYQKEQAGVMVRPERIFDDYCFDSRYTNESFQAKNTVRLYKNDFEDYSRWKIAFSK